MQRPALTTATRRRGSMLPVVVITLLVVLAMIALVLNRLWIDAARNELQVATDAAALAAGGALVDDDLVRPGADKSRRLALARQAAGLVAARNFVAGTAVELNVAEDGDVRFGRIVTNSQSQTVFLETDHDPRSVAVTGRRDHDHSNPLGLLLAGVTGQWAADLASRSEASIDNRLVAIRAAESFNVPAFPLAILQVDPSGRQKITWQTQIDLRLGPDLYGYDASTNQVVMKPDGIPEILLNGVDPNVPPNSCLIDVGTRLGTDKIVRQINEGWTAKDLKEVGEEVRWTGRASTFGASPLFGNEHYRAFTAMKGQPRIVVLYISAAAEASSATVVTCQSCVAGRVMDVIPVPGQSTRIVFQPAVLSTRAAVLAAESKSHGDVAENPYLYKLTLTQ